MTDLIDTVQKTALDDAFIELFDVELKYKGSNGAVQTELLHLTDGLEDPNAFNLWMPYEETGGTTTWAQYLACPIQIEGISIDNAGAASRPTLNVANVAAIARITDYDDTLTPSTAPHPAQEETNIDAILQGLNISKNEDILGSIITYRKTLLKNTFIRANDNNTYRWYPYDHPTKTGTGTGIYTENQAPTAIEFPEQKFVIDRVAGENNILVQFELANPLDVQGLQVPNRYVIGKYCPWEYKGAVAGSVKSGCPWRSTGYTTRGAFEQNPTTPYATNDVVTNGGQRYYVIGDPTHAGVESSVAADNTAHPGTWGLGPWFDIDNNPTTQANDVCGKTIQSCKCRFHPKTSASSNAVHQNTDRGLPFGGFPGSRKFK
jgi:phage-related protein